MLTIQQIFAKNQRVKGVGLEVEVEFDPNEVPLVNVGGVWLFKPEGSIRNGIEYFTRQPIPVDTLAEHVIRLTSALNKARVIKDSPRTSVHVHVNVLDMTPVQVWTAALAYWILENPLMNFCGVKQRVGNLFCLRACDAEGLLQLCYRDLDGKAPFSRLPNDSVKYSSQNLGAVSRFGSIEYRGMRGTTDPLLITMWARAVFNIVERSREFKSPSDLMNFYIKASKDEFLQKFLDKDFIDIVKAQAGYIGIIEDNVMMLSELAYYHDDWAAWGEKINEHFLKKGPRLQVSTEEGVEVELPTAMITNPNIIEPTAQRTMLSSFEILRGNATRR